MIREECLHNYILNHTHTHADRARTYALRGVAYVMHFHARVFIPGRFGAAVPIARARGAAANRTLEKKCELLTAATDF